MRAQPHGPRTIHEARIKNKRCRVDVRCEAERCAPPIVDGDKLPRGSAGRAGARRTNGRKEDPVSREGGMEDTTAVHTAERR